MPAVPEILHRQRAIGLIEILRKTVAEQTGNADGNIGIGAEIAIDHQRIAVKGSPYFLKGRAGGIDIDRIDQSSGQIVGDHHFFEQPAEDQRQRGPERDRHPARGLGQLRQKLAGAHNRTRHQMRKKADIERQIQQAV